MNPSPWTRAALACALVLPALAHAHGGIPAADPAPSTFDAGTDGWSAGVNAVVSQAYDGADGYLRVEKSAGAPASGEIMLSAVELGPVSGTQTGSDFTTLVSDAAPFLLFGFDVYDPTGGVTPRLRLVYESPSYQGWYHLFDAGEVGASARGDGWKSYTLLIDSREAFATPDQDGWDKATANSHGWFKDKSTSYPGFGLIFSHVYSVDIQLVGDAAAFPAVGIDNVFYQGVAAVPEPGEWAMLAAGLPFMVWAARRRRQAA